MTDRSKLNEEKEDNTTPAHISYHYPVSPRLLIRITNIDHVVELEAVGYSTHEVKESMTYLIEQQKKMRKACKKGDKY